MSRYLLVLAIIAGGGVKLALAGAASADEQILQAARVATDGPGLVDYFRRHSLAEGDRARLEGLIRQLGDEKFDKREKASQDLVAAGPPALPLLRQAVKNPDVEIARRSENCLRQIEKGAGTAVVSAAVRLLSLRRPPGAAEALLSFCPTVEDTQVSEEIETSLAALARSNPEVARTLNRTLDEPVPARRATAAVALCRLDGFRQVPVVRRLLKDSDRGVRLRVALALGDLWEAEAVPVLIALVGELPPNQVWQAEEYLRRLASGPALPNAAGADPASRRQHQLAWETWWRGIDDGRLLEFFRQRTPAEPDRDRILGLIRQLGDDAYEVRERASAALVQAGPAALPLLRQGVRDPDIEVVRRAEACLRQLDRIPSIGQPATVARLVALRKPAGGAEALLAYLAFADDDVEGEDLHNALAALALAHGQPDPVLVRALGDRLPQRRIAAGVAFCRAGAWMQVPAARRLLQDPDPLVRFRLALALIDQKDRDGIPPLIDLLTELPEAQVSQAEEVLRRLAGEQGPAPTGNGAIPARHKASREAWSIWWREQGPRLDLAHVDKMPRLLGYTFLVEFTNGRNGRVLELGTDFRERWQLDNTPWPIDAQLLPGNRLLLAEFYDNRVAERNFQGQILWEKVVSQSPIAARRLASGNTFIATQNQLLEVDRSGKEVFSLNRPGILAVQKLRDGRIACVVSGTFALLDAAGKELKSFPVGQVNNYSAIDVLATGRVLIPHYNTNEIVEYDADGKVIWKAAVNRPTAVSRLPNGHTLVACRDAQLVVEVDRTGKVTWEHKTAGYPWRAYRR